MVRVRRFGVIRTANVLAVMYLIVTLVFAIPFALILATGPITVIDANGRSTTIDISPFFALLIAVFYAAVGWVVTALGCLVYNLAARIVGGVTFEVEQLPSSASELGPPVPPGPMG